MIEPLTGGRHECPDCEPGLRVDRGPGHKVTRDQPVEYAGDCPQQVVVAARGGPWTRRQERIDHAGADVLKPADALLDEEAIEQAEGQFLDPETAPQRSFVRQECVDPATERAVEAGPWRHSRSPSVSAATFRARSP